MDERERRRADLQLQANQALTTIRGLLMQEHEQWAVLTEARRQLAVLDAQEGKYNAAVDAAAQLD